MRIFGGAVCCPDGVRRDQDIVIDGGRIKVTPSSSVPPSGEETVDARGLFVLPGFIEIHTHGAGLFEFTMGRYNLDTREFERSEDIYAEEFPRYAARRASTGATGIYPGTWSSSIEQQQFCFRQLKRYMDSPGNGQDGSRMLGGLLEGTFLNSKMAGAQNPKYFFKPSADIFDQMNDSGIIRLANVVPDFGEESCRLTEYLTKKGISVGAGHTDGTYDQFKRAMEKGLKYCIHFMNGPISGSFKQFNGGGALEAVLREDLFAEVIMDGIHVAPWYVLDVLTRKGPDRVMAISDAMFASQAQGVREFTINGIHGRVDDSDRFVYVVGKERLTLFSSVLTLDKAFSNLVSWLTVDSEGAWTRKHPAMSLNEAVTTAAKCCATNIVRMIKHRGGDDLETGELTAGKWADLVLAEITGRPGEYRLAVKQVYVRGRKVWEK